VAIILVGRSTAKLQSVVDAIKQHHPTVGVLVFAADLASIVDGFFLLGPVYFKEPSGLPSPRLGEAYVF
jgi:hypothetical protein